MNKNRSKGVRWELTLMNQLKKFFPNILTSRFESRSEDNNCVDFCYTGEYAFQAKNLGSTPNFKEIFGNMKTPKIKVIAWKNNRIHGKTGEYAIIQWDDFLKIIEKNLKIN